MYEMLLDYGRRKNQEHLQKIATARALAAMCPDRIGLSERILLGLSDFLLYLGARIRPKDLCASSQESFLSQNHTYINSVEGA